MLSSGIPPSPTSKNIVNLTQTTKIQLIESRMNELLNEARGISIDF